MAVCASPQAGCGFGVGTPLKGLLPPPHLCLTPSRWEVDFSPKWSTLRSQESILGVSCPPGQLFPFINGKWLSGEPAFLRDKVMLLARLAVSEGTASSTLLCRLCEWDRLGLRLSVSFAAYLINTAVSLST